MNLEDYQLKNKNFNYIQFQHRNNIIDKFNIEEGSSILEIGCGQGDATYVLASKIGDNGIVVGIDIADRDYGSPMTLGQSLDLLLKSKLRSRINIKLNTDLSKDTTWNEFKEEYPNLFDYIFLIHSSWYMESDIKLKKLLNKLYKLGKKLCFVEYDPEPKYFEQIPHYISSIIQSELYFLRNLYIKDDNKYNPNIKTIITPKKIKDICYEIGWKNIINEFEINTENLQDGKWEISECLSEHFKKYIKELESIIDDDKHKNIINHLYVQIDILNNMKKNNKSLTTKCIMFSS